MSADETLEQIADSALRRSNEALAGQVDFLNEQVGGLRARLDSHNRVMESIVRRVRVLEQQARPEQEDGHLAVDVRDDESFYEDARFTEVWDQLKAARTSVERLTERLEENHRLVEALLEAECAHPVGWPDDCVANAIRHYRKWATGNLTAALEDA